jgi:DNA-binding response OmpR family regulator
MATVLVADDSLSVRKVTERLLTQAGMEVFSVESGAEAMRWMAARRPDLMIADVIMMDMSGYEVCSYIRSNATLRDMPVLLISGVVDEEVMRNADDCRANGVIKKPFFGSSLPNRVLELLATAKQPSPASSQDVPGASKVYRISEGQLQSVRDAMNLIKELEDGLIEERKRAAQLEEQINALRETSGEAGRRISNLEARLEAETQATQVGHQADQLESINEWIKSLEGRTLRLEEQAQAFNQKVGDPGTRLAELETRFGETEERSRQLGEAVHAFREQVGDPGGRIAELEAKLGETEKLSQDTLKTLEARLAAEEGRGQRLMEQVREIQQSVGRFPDFESRLSKEECLLKELREHLREQVQGVRDAGSKAVERIRDLERRLTEEATRAQKLGTQLQAFGDTAEWIKKLENHLQELRETGGDALTRLQKLETRMEQEEKQSARASERIAMIEPVAASMERLVRALADIARLALKPGEGIGT